MRLQKKGKDAEIQKDLLLEVTSLRGSPKNDYVNIKVLMSAISRACMIFKEAGRDKSIWH